MSTAQDMSVAGQTGAETSTPETPVKAWSWSYLNNSSTYFGVVLAICGGAPHYHFYGPIWALAFVVPAIAGLLVLVTFVVRAAQGDARAERLSDLAQPGLVLLWMISACALFATGDRAAWIIAVTIPCSWLIHVIFSPAKDIRVMRVSLALCAVPLVGFLLYGAWATFDWWIAAPASISACAMLLSIDASAKWSRENLDNLRKAMAEMASTRQRLEFSIEASGEGYFEIDLNTMAYRPNEAMLVNFGYTSAVSNADELRDRIHPDNVEEAFGNLKRVIDDELMGWNQDLQIQMADGDYRWMQLRARLLETANERTLLCTLTDLRERKVLEADLRLAKENAEASSRAKSEFLANMSHEIRTPLNGVLGMAQALEADGLNEEQRKKVAIILDSGKSLTAILNDVLDLSKIEAGKLEISPVAGDLLHTMKRVRQLFQVTAEEKGLELGARFSSDLPQRLVYDPVRVRQCVSNLISNAVKFTATGRVEIAISSTETAPGEHMVRIDVIDTGIGLTDETISRLFSAFTQADGATTRTFGGTGLGLAISRRLARLMGGDLTVVSAPGTGSTFTLTFTATVAAAMEEPRRPAVAAPRQGTVGSLRGKRVLLTDDNAVNRQVIKLFMAPQGCEVVEATNGKEALDAIASQPFDIVLLDVHMPVMDGKEAIQRIRAAKADWSSVPVIALTADAMSGDREKYLGLGMTDYVSKPVDQRELIAKMHTVLNLEAPAEADRKTG